MNNEEKLNLKIVALKESFNKRVADLDDEVANLRVALTELNQTLQNTQQEFESYKQAHPEETNVPQEQEESDPEN